MKDGARKTEYLTLNGAEYPTQKLARQKLQSLLLAVNEGEAANYVQRVYFGTLLDRYIDEEMPQKSSTRGSNTSIIESHIRHRWGSVALTEMKEAAIRIWLNGLPLAPLSKGHIRSLMHKLFDLSQLWEYAELGRNPIELVKVKGVTKREKQVVILTPEQAVAIIGLLKEPYSLMVMTVAALGLRLSEMLDLHWDDIDFERKIVTIRRSAYRGSVDEAKTKASHAEVHCLMNSPPYSSRGAIRKTTRRASSRRTSSRRASGCFRILLLDSHIKALAFSNGGSGQPGKR